MISTKIVSAFAAAMALVSMASADDSTSSSSSSIKLIPTATVTLPAGEMNPVGCFESATPLENHGPYLYQSEGNCQLICIEQKKPVMGLSDGENCWCGDLIPQKDSKVDNGTCDTECRGDDSKLCGGPNLLWVELTGITKNRILNYEPVSSSSSSSSSVASSTKAPSDSTSSSEPTASATVLPVEEEEKKGPNKAGIAAGVVVGVVVLAASITGILLFLRHKRRREVEEEYRRRNAENPFIGGKLHTSSSSMTDSRLDPEFNNRRQSNGSIADNEDFSRRILKVTNV